MKNYVHSGRTLTVTAPRNVKVGEGVLVIRKNLSGQTISTAQAFGIAEYDCPLGGSLEIRCEGCFDIPKDASVFGEADAVFWDDDLLVCTNNPSETTINRSDNLRIGICELSQASGIPAPGGLTADPTVRVKLDQLIGVSYFRPEPYI